MTEATPACPPLPPAFTGSDWFDPLEEAVRGQVRSFIEELLEEELEAALGRGRYERGAVSNGRRHGHRPRQLVTTFGPLTLTVPRARLRDEAGEQEWKSELLPAYKRLSHRAEALIAEVYLAGMNTRRARRALAKLFEGHVGKDVVSRAWQRTRSAWEAWQQRDLTDEDIVRLILDGTVVKVRLDRKATAISLLIVLGVRRDGQKVVLAIKNMGGESEAAWRAQRGALVACRTAARTPGGRCSTICWRAAWPGPSWSSSTAARVSRRRSRASGRTSRSNVAPCTRNATCSPMPHSICTTRSRPTSTT
jgi:putative transposase